MGLDEPGAVSQKQQQEEANGKPDAKGQSLDGARRAFAAIFQQIIECRAEAADDNQEYEYDDDFQDGSAKFVESTRNNRGRHGEKAVRDYSFKPGWKASLGFLAVFALFVNLGFWQLHRADEKKALLEAREERGRDGPVQLRGVEARAEDLRYRRVVVAGEYDPDHQFLVDNQVHDQQPGYLVLTPLRIAGSGTAVLVNRGWVPLGADRTQKPDISLKTRETHVAGVADYLPRVGFKLQGAEIPGPGWPSVVQVPEPERLAERLGYPVLPYQVLLDPAAPEGYVRAWREVSPDPGKNRGYALQWFLFAAVAAVLYVRHGLKAGSRYARH
jgi:surfeit locus 1 family protein